MPARTDRTILGLTLRQHIGGRWAISLLAYGINAPINIALTFSGNANATGVTAQQTLMLAVLGYLGFGVVALLGDVSVFRHRRVRPASIAAVVLLGALAGLVRGLIIGLGAQALSSDAAAFTATRVVTSTLLGAVLVPVLALLLSITATYRARRDELVAEAAELQAQVMREDGASEAIRAALLASVRADLEEVARTGDPQKARDVGREMWTESTGAAVPRLPWRAVVAQSITRNPFPTVPVASVWALSAIGTLVATLGVVRGASQVVASVLVIAVMFALGRRWVAAGGGGWAFVVVMGVVIVLTGPVASVLFDPRPWPAGAGLVLANTVWLPMLTIVIGVVMTAVRASEDVLTDLAGSVDASAVAVIAAHEETTRLRRELAAQMHGTVHSRLLAATAITSDVSVSDAASAAIEEALRPTAADLRSLGDRVDEVATTWRGLMSVVVDVAPAVVALGPPASETVARVVEEALANSYRHGRASAIHIRVRSDGAGVIVTIEDDGVQPVVASGTGMGSALFDAASRGMWSLTPLPDGSGTRLSVHVPGG